MGRKRIVRVEARFSFSAKVPDGGDGTLDFRLIQHLGMLRDDVGDEAMCEFIKAACREKFAGGGFSVYELQHSPKPGAGESGLESPEPAEVENSRFDEFAPEIAMV